MIIPKDMIVHVAKVFQGEYEIGYTADDPVILDIGANVGGFTVWALDRWPKSKVFCYEPIEANFEMLAENTKHEGGRVKAFNLGVGEPGERGMFYGANNCGEASLFQRGQQQDVGEIVTVIDPKELPKADIVKIDTEGAEIEILERIKIKPAVYLIEFHGAANRVYIDTLLSDYTLIECNMTHPDYGVVKYVRTDLL